MKYQEIFQQYTQRNQSALVDGITTALSHLDEVSVALGLLEESGLLTETLGALSLGLPFAVIAITEQGSVVLGKKTQKAALQDGSFRAVKTGAGLAAGAATTLALGGVLTGGLAAIPAIPVAVGTRLLMEKTRGSILTANRVKQRIQRLEAITKARQERMPQL